MLRQQIGFTLLEILIVVSILGMLAIAVIPSLSASKSAGLDLATDKVAAAMRFARSEAERTGTPIGFQQQSTAKRIRVFHLDTATLPATLVYDVYDPVSKKLYDIDLNILPYAQVDGVSRVTTFHGICNQSGIVFFDSQGTPWCADPTTTLLRQMLVTVVLGNLSKVIHLDGITGRVSIE